MFYFKKSKFSRNDQSYYATDGISVTKCFIASSSDVQSAVLLPIISFLRKEVLIHSGMTQEFYLNRLDLDNHCESILSFRFGVQSLFRISFEKVIKGIDTFSKKDLSELPESLRKMIDERLLDDDAFHSNANPPNDPPFERAILHAGI